MLILVNCMQGSFATSHVERDEKAGLTFNVVWDLTARGMGMYSLFCVPDDEREEPYLLAKVQDEPCYTHRYRLISSAQQCFAATADSSFLCNGCLAGWLAGSFKHANI